MKKTCITILNVLLILCGFGQPMISPHWTAALCPEQDIEITFDLPFPADNYVITYPISGCTIVSNINSAEKAIIRFSDKKEVHKFRLYHASAGMEYDYVFTSIKTIDGIKPTWNPSIPPYITPLPPDHDDAMDYSGPAAACGINSFTYTAPVLKYKNSAGTEFGNPMMFYEWLPPKGWKINGVTCDGINPIMGSSPSADITTDPITGGEIKFRARNDCNPGVLKRSSWYRIKILGRPDLRLTVNAVNPVTINCPDQADKVFTLENTNDFTSCITGYQWSIGNNWLYNGSPAPATISTSVPSLTLKPIPGLQPGNVSVKLLVNGVEHINSYTCPIIYNQCVLSINPAFVPVVCSTPEARTFTVNNTAYIPSITGFVWDLGATPNGWNYNGSAAPASITTTSNSLTLVSDGGLTAPHNVTVTPQINSQPSTPSTSIVQFTICCPGPPTNLTAEQITNNDVTLSWSAVPGADYFLEVTGTTGGTTSTSGTNSYSYFGQPGTGQFRVRGYCQSNGFTEWSEWKSFVISPPPPPGSCETDYIHGQALYNLQIRVSWGHVYYPSSYNIKLERCCGGSGTTIYSGITTNPAIITAPFGNGSSYYIGVQAVCSTGLGPWVMFTSGSPTVNGVYKANSNMNDSLSLAKITVGDSNLEQNELKLFPNPSSKNVTLSFISPSNNKTEIKIVDQIGKVVFISSIIPNEGINNRLVNLPVMSNGLYFVIVSQNNITLKQKLIISK